MLIINNGYGKSGTTWIQRGLRYYFKFSAFDDRFQNPKLANASLDQQSILTFVRETNLKSTHYYSKSHWAANEPIEDGRLAQALNKLDGVVVINSIRNIGDSVVSWYHHQKREGETRAFDPWFWDIGTGFVHRYMSHHMSWSHMEKSPFLFSYENLKRDPFASFAAFRSEIGLVDDRTDAEFNHHMDFDVTKSQSNTVHMRKGVVGDRVNYLDDAMVDHVENLFDKRRFFDKCGAYFDQHGVDASELRLRQSDNAVVL